MANAIFSVKSSRAELVNAISSLIEQLPAVVLNATMVINGVTLTVAQVVTQLQADIAIIKAAEAARLQLHDANVAEEQMRAALQTFGDGLRGFIASKFGTASTQYATLGFARKRVTPPTAEALVVRAEKMRATRLARGTKGKKQLAAIHGAPPAAAEPAVVKPGKPG